MLVRKIALLGNQPAQTWTNCKNRLFVASSVRMPHNFFREKKFLFFFRIQLFATSEFFSRRHRRQRRLWSHARDWSAKSCRLFCRPGKKCVAFGSSCCCCCYNCCCCCCCCVFVLVVVVVVEFAVFFIMAAEIVVVVTAASMVVDIFFVKYICCFNFCCCNCCERLRCCSCHLSTL